MKRFISILLVLVMTCIPALADFQEESSGTDEAAEEAVIEEAPAVEEEPVTAEETAAAEEPVVGEGPVAEEEPIVGEPAAEETPVIEEASADEAEPETDGLAEEIEFTETPAEESCDFAPVYDSDTALAGYMNDMLGDELFDMGDVPVLDGGCAARDMLNDTEKEMYDQIVTAVRAIASGSTNSTSVTVTVSSIDTARGYTAEELGVESVLVQTELGYASNADAVNALYAEAGYDLCTVVSAVRYDCPFDMYWFSGRAVWSTPTFTFSYSLSAPENATIRFCTNTVVLCFGVDSRYSAAGYYTTNITSADTSAVVSAAQSVVNAASGLSDYDKLAYYRDWICSAVSYDYTAGTVGANAYGNLGPWNVLNVFDGNSSTNAVCEGYGKAFQYLCDLTDFDGDVTCLYVIGTANGASHGWNVVNMPNGESYLVDVTNCDTGTAGYPDKLFLVGGSSVSGFYTFRGIRYAYSTSSPDMVSLLGSGLLTLDTDNYDPAADHVHTYDGGTVTAAATTAAEGVMTYTCTICGESYTEAIPKLLSGWVEDGGNTYYYVNGVMVTGTAKKIGDYVYLFGADGAMQTNTWYISGTSRFYFGADGRKVVNGARQIGDKVYLFSSSGVMKTNCWYTISDGRKFYFGADGAKVTDTARQIDGKVYLFGTSGAMRTNTWYTISDGRKFYFGADGVKVTDTARQIDGKVYLFGTSGAMQTNTWYTIASGKKFYFGADGVKVTDTVRLIGGFVYRFGTNGAMQTDVWYTEGTKSFYFGSDGRKVTDTVLLIGGFYYSFRTNGVLRTGGTVMYNGATCYIGADGRLYTDSTLQNLLG